MVNEIVVSKKTAGLRRSAVAERARLREEWSTLKGIEDENESAAKVKKKRDNVFTKNINNIEVATRTRQSTENLNKNKDGDGEALRGVVALVDLGSNMRALALRAALTAMGASVKPVWDHTITHVIWSKGGCRKTRSEARSLGCNVVSPLWVEACAASSRRVSEKLFPSTSRPSDIPSPATLCRFLKRAEKENWLLQEMVSDDEENPDPAARQARLRISTDTDDNTKSSRETTRESIENFLEPLTHRGKTPPLFKDLKVPQTLPRKIPNNQDIECRVNTAPRRALPVSLSPPPVNPKSKRRLFTARAEGNDDDSESENLPSRLPKAKTGPEKATTRPEKSPTHPRKSSTRPRKSPTRSDKSPTRPRKSPTRSDKSPTRPRKSPVRPRKSPTQSEKSPIRSKKAPTSSRKILRRVEVPERQKKTKKYNLTQEQKKNLEKAKQLAKRLATDNNRRIERPHTQRRIDNIPRIVLSGMPKSQYQAVVSAIQALNGKIQKHVNYKTTHVLLGSCKEEKISNNKDVEDTGQKNKSPLKNTPKKNVSLKSPINKLHVTTEAVIHATNRNSQDIDFHENNDLVRNRGDENKTNDNNDDNVRRSDHNMVRSDNNSLDNIIVACDSDDRIDNNVVVSDKNNANQVRNDDLVASDNNESINDDMVKENENHDISDCVITNVKHLRTLKTLLGAARGCLVLNARWALDSLEANTWQHHLGYEVTHLLKITQKARMQRTAFGKMHKEYAYNVFRGMRVYLSEIAEQRDAAMQLLSLCGAVVTNDTQNAQRTSGNSANDDRTQNGGATQNGRVTQNGGDDNDVVIIGRDNGEVSSKWVFDSVVAGRPRCTKRYINKSLSIQD